MKNEYKIEMSIKQIPLAVNANNSGKPICSFNLITPECQISNSKQTLKQYNF
jgi:hypothetical protein